MQDFGGIILNSISNDIIQFLKSRGFIDAKKSLTEHESLTESGAIDSIGLLQLVDYLESTYNIEIPVEKITPDNFDTLAGISRSVSGMRK